MWWPVGSASIDPPSGAEGRVRGHEHPSGWAPTIRVGRPPSTALSHAETSERRAVVPREASLSRAFVELADNLVDDFDVVELLTRLADRYVDLLDVDRT